MDFSRSATDLFNRLRGFQPWPGAFTIFKGKALQVHRAQLWQHTARLTPEKSQSRERGCSLAAPRALAKGRRRHGAGADRNST